MTHVAVAGAGIGGLTAALALARIGIDVTLLERAPQLAAVGAGLQLSPNATRVLRDMDLLERLRPDATHPTRIVVRGAATARTIVTLPLDNAEARWGAPYLVALRADLQAVLAAAVRAEARVTLHLDAALCGVATRASGIVATIRHGGIIRTLEADALIGADGIRSAVRAHLADAGDTPRETGRTAWRALVAATSLAHLCEDGETGLWLGRDAHLVHYAVDGGRRLNIVAVTRETGGCGADLWSTPGDPADIRARFATWHRTARELIDAPEAWTRWPLYDLAPLDAWNAGPIALLGDAAHPILPFLAQGSAQAIEDAAALVTAMRETPDIRSAFARYSQARRQRAERVQETSRRLGRIYHLSGAAALARDASMRLVGGRALIARYDWLYSPHIANNKRK